MQCSTTSTLAADGSRAMGEGCLFLGRHTTVRVVAVTILDVHTAGDRAGAHIDRVNAQEKGAFSFRQ